MENNLGELARRLEITAQKLSDDLVINTRMPVEGNRQPAGILHGGANGALVEQAASSLALLRAPSGKLPVGTELNVSQLRPATSGLRHRNGNASLPDAFFHVQSGGNTRRYRESHRSGADDTRIYQRVGTTRRGPTCSMTASATSRIVNRRSMEVF